VILSFLLLLENFFLYSLICPTRTKASGSIDTDAYKNGVCFALEVTKFFIHQMFKAGWLTKELTYPAVFVAQIAVML
jgi:hypothetical protein